MNLKSLEINGFKSFARKAELLFNSPITSIVGPNGSGKSNVAEAFRFVLGEQSIKSMRGKRGEDLIWNGSGDLPKGNRASVRITFDNSRRIFPIDFDDVSIERVVNRDSTNEYYINNSQVRLKDVSELLASAHIGASGHHIISQGEADRILGANMRERKEIIEDALGLKVYQYKKQESLRKLDKTKENIEKVESLRREIAPHIRFLKKQVEKIEKAKELRDLLRIKYREYFARENKYLTLEKIEIENESKKPKEEYEALSKDLERAKLIVSESNKKDEKSSLLIDIDSKLKSVRMNREGLLGESGRIDGEISSIERFIKREEEKDRNESERTIYWRSVESFVKEIDATIGNEESSNYSGDVFKLSGIIKKIKDLCARFVGENKEIVDNRAMDDARSEITELKNKKARIVAEITDLLGHEARLGEEYRKIQYEIEREKDTNRDAEKEIFRIIARQNEVRGLLDRIRMRTERFTHDEIIFKQDIEDAYHLVGREAVDYEGDIVEIETRDSQEISRKEVERLKIRLEENGGVGGGEVEKEYTETMERDVFLGRELEDLIHSSETLNQVIADLESRLKQEFEEGVKKINSEFSRLFALMFGGGSASIAVIREKKKRRSDTALDLDDLGEIEIDKSKSNDGEENVEYEEGIDINVSLPRKKIKGLMMLSGGERALTSIALLFAISQVNPPPFIILDETDAALDEANSRKYGDMVEALSKYSELVLITHNRETMSRAGILYGVTMGKEGASKLLSIQFDDAVAVAK